MKKALYIITAGLLAVLAASCVEEKYAVIDVTNATAPVLNSYEVTEDAIVASYTPGSFNAGFNEKITPNHTFALVSLGNEATNKIISSSNKDGVLTLKTLNLAKSLISMGVADGSVVNLELAVRATLQDPSKDNGVNGYIDSDAHVVVKNFKVEIPDVQGSPYEDYTEASTWSVIGSLSAYEISWDGDLNMWTDGGGNHVAAHVTLKAGDELKFRKDQDWGVNMGGEFGSVDEEFSVSQDGPNIVIKADGVYDLFLYEGSSSALVAPAYDPYPDFTEASTWSVIGSLSEYGISWDSDLAMVTDGTTHAAFSVKLGADDEFKFRKDADWGVNLGGDFGGLDADFDVSQDGPNVKVGAAGVYDLFVNPDASTAKVAAASGVKVSSKIGGEEPPVPQEVKGWNIIGLNGDWENDILATNDGNLWTAYITAESDTEFKWRKDGAWEENYGGTMVALGEPFAAEAGGANIQVPAGFYKAVLDLDALTITVSNGDVWSLIGDFNSWGGDVDMVLTDGKWVAPATKIEGGFKLRKNHGWDENLGGVLVALGEPFAAVPGGDNITVEAGTYVVVYDPEAATITVDSIGWGVVGTINGWGGTPDVPMAEEGLFLVAKNVALTASDEIKIRYNQDWSVNRGGKSIVGMPVLAVDGGDNIKVPADGAYDIYYRPDCEVIIVNNAGADLNYWGVVGTINGWGAPDHILYVNDDNLLESEELNLSATDEIKIRLNEDWAENRGGAFAELGEPIAVEPNGSNIKVGREAKVKVVYNAEAETITLVGEYVGDAPALPKTMYMIGSQFGGWDWASDGVVELVPVWGTQGVFWCTRWIDHSQGFKFCAERAWSGDFTGAGEVGYTVSDGNCWVAEDGIYTIYVNADGNVVEIAPAEVYGLGDAVFVGGGWDFDSAVKFTAEGDKMVITTTGSGELRVASRVQPTVAVEGCTPNGWFDWWKTEFISFEDGKIVYRGLDGDQARVQVAAGEKITIDFNAGTMIVGEGGAPADVKITIDGDMSDWADVPGTETPDNICKETKVWNDDEYFYVYLKSAPGNRGSQLWGETAGYYYLDFDWDNNPETGIAENSNPGFDCWCYLYIFGGSAEAPIIKEHPNGDGKQMSIAGITAKGVITDELIEIELSIPRADMVEVAAGTEARILTWRSKDGTKIEHIYTVK